MNPVLRLEGLGPKPKCSVEPAAAGTGEAPPLDAAQTNVEVKAGGGGAKRPGWCCCGVHRQRAL